MLYQSPNIATLTRSQILETITELRSFGIDFNCSISHNDQTLKYHLQCVQDQYETFSACVYTVKDLSSQYSDVKVIHIPEVSLFYWQCYDEVSDTHTWKNENILLTDDWKEISSELFKALLEAHQLEPYTVLSDDTFENIGVFTVHHYKGN